MKTALALGILGLLAARPADAQPISEQIRHSCPAQAPTEIPVCEVGARVSVRVHHGPTLLTYLIVAVN